MRERERCGEGGRAGNIKREGSSGGKMKEDKEREKERGGVMGESACRCLLSHTSVCPVL